MLTDKRTLGFNDVLIVPEASDINSRKEVNLEKEFIFNNGIRKIFVPIIAANMESIGTFKVAKVLSKYKMITCIHKQTPLHEYITNLKSNPEIFPYVACTVGLNDYNYLSDILQNIPIDIICLDVANGYMKQFVQYVSDIKDSYPDKIIISGNVATPTGAVCLHEAGADIIKIGIGSGSVCTTRYKTGVGIPQITAITECSRISTCSPYLCSDGGCTSPGDIAKAFVAGADFVMIGGLLAGTEETGVEFHGSAYLKQEVSYRTSEGKSVGFIDITRSLDHVIQNILGGLRSTGSYIGQRNIEDFYKAELVQVTEQTNDWFGRPE